MDSEVTTPVNGAEVQPQIDGAEGTKPEAITRDDIAKAVDEVNRKWQSKFDQVLGEKKAVEGKALTVEQRIAQIEQERQNERLDWSRKEAKAKAQIDDELEAAIRLYAGTDSEQIATGAANIRAIIDKVVADNTEKAVKAALEKVGSQPSPKGGQASVVEITRESLKTPEGRKAMLEQAKKTGGAIPIVE